MIRKLQTLILMVPLVALACSDSTGEPTPDDNSRLLKSLIVTVDGVNYHADINDKAGTANIGAIQYTGNISGAEYSLADGATITPDPKTLVTDWPREQVFTVTQGDRSQTFTMHMTAYVAKWPEADGEVIFFDDFDTLDYNTWSHIPAGTAAWQIFMSASPDQAYVKDGNLYLVAEQVDGVVQCGGIKTEGKVFFDNCRIDACVRFIDDCEQAGQAVWLMPDWQRQLYAGWPHGGEIDIMEHSWSHDYVQQTLHSYYIDIYNETPAGRASYAGYNKDGYNIFSVEMTSNEIVLLVNGKETQRYSNMKLPDEAEVKQWPFSAPYYLILSIGGGSRTNHISPEQRPMMAVDWVRATRIRR